MTFTVDRHARIVIIGGGAVGCSLAYQLGCAGAADVLLLEKAQLTHGCTWHAAGLVGQLRSRRNLTRLMQNSVAVLDRLQAESQAQSGQAIDWKKVGSLRLASSAARLSEIRRSMTQAKSFGFECHSLSPREAEKLFPYISVKGVVGAAFVPSDGYVDPYALTQAYAAVARRRGVIIEEGTMVTDIIVKGRRVVGVATNNGSIGCEILVNCAGPWAKRVGELADIPLAAGVVEHQYFVTEKTLDLPDTLPTLRDPDMNFYLKPDVGGFAIGGWEEGTRGCWRGKPPWEFGRTLFDANLDRVALFATPCATRIPLLNDIGIRTVVNGPIPVSADGEPIMGLAPELDNLYVACGFTAGIAASAGAGEAMCNWILHGDPGMDLWAFDVRRFARQHANGRWLESRAIEAYAAYYAIHWPCGEPRSGRRLRRSPLYDALAMAGAVFGAKFGWERANWFAPPGAEAVDQPSFEAKPNWFVPVGEEVRAIRERVALIDQTSFAKMEITGPGAFDYLQRLAGNDLAGGPGRCVYTQLCNERGGIEADVVVMRIAEDAFYLVTGAGFGVRDGHWLRRHLPGDGSVMLCDVTSARAVINLCGPRARDVLQSVSDDDVSNDALPFLSLREIEIGNAHAWAARVGYVGELGFELHIPTEYGADVYETLWQAGAGHGISNVGYRAMESARLEKGYLYWSSDIGPDHSPYEAGLGFCVALNKGDFIGRDALVTIKRDGVKRKLCTFTIEGFAPLHGGEAILGHDGDEVLGTTTSAGYGHYVGKTIAFGYVPTERSTSTEFRIEAFGDLYAARRGPRALYDAKARRLRS